MTNRIEAELLRAFGRAETGAPSRLASAMHHALFPGGARVRPRLCIAVATACGDDAPRLADATAAAIEMLHCASLVHDDLPCFDDADMRRGKLSVHRAFGEPIAVLVGDALIVQAFETLAMAGADHPHRVAPLVLALARAVGTPSGLVAGQAWETEPHVPVQRYHAAKTGALFVCATSCGAIAAGCDPAPWTVMGAKLGEAYQVADDLLDALAAPEEAGKPTQRDVALGRPSAVKALGVDGAVSSLRRLVVDAADAVPECPGAPSLRTLVHAMSERLVPAGFKQSAA